MARFDCVCFDLDGTICDSKPGILNGFRYMFDKMGKPTPTDTELLQFIGLSLDKSLAKYTDFDDEELPRAIVTFREYYAEKGLFEGELYPGADDLIRAIAAKNIDLFLVTAKPQPFAEKILKHFGLDAFFKGIYGLDPDAEYPGKAVHLNLIRSKHGYQNIVMIGDRDLDVNAAHEANTSSIGVTYGYASDGELEAASPSFIANDTKEIKGYIL